jgi:hypothetical protein
VNGGGTHHTLTELLRQLRRASKVLLGTIVGAGLRQQDPEVRVGPRSGDQIAGALEQLDRSLIRSCCRRQVAEPVKDKGPLHLDEP